jgi:hypothetical protein
MRFNGYAKVTKTKNYQTTQLQTPTRIRIRNAWDMNEAARHATFFFINIHFNPMYLVIYVILEWHVDWKSESKLEHAIYIYIVLFLSSDFWRYVVCF